MLIYDLGSYESFLNCVATSLKAARNPVSEVSMAIQESTENYLETILILKSRLGAVRSVDIVNELEYTRPSVSVAMRKLRERGFVHVSADGFITLTESGLEVARDMYERHSIISGFLILLGVDEKTAVRDACRIEHVISRQSFEKIQELVSQGFEPKRGP